MKGRNPACCVRARAASGEGRLGRLSETDEVEAYLDDAAHYPGGTTEEVFLPGDEAAVAGLLKSDRPLLAVGAQSSLTGGATPRADSVISMTRMDAVGPWLPGSVKVEAGVVLAPFEAQLKTRGLYYPPAPTFDGATVGGTVATDAAGAATFKHGTTRHWVRGLTVVVAGGDVLDLRRGQVRASPEGHFEIAMTNGSKREVEIPGYEMPAVPKHSAGYWAEPGMDLVDLFIGSEGTLGVVTEIELGLIGERPAWFTALVPVADDAAAVALVASLRESSMETWAGGRGADVAAVEYIDRRSIELLEEDGAMAALALDASVGALLLIQAELTPDFSGEEAARQLASFEDLSLEAPLAVLARILAEHKVLEATVAALPGEEGRRKEMFALREALPEGVNRRVGEAQRNIDAAISKSGGDVIVPFASFERALGDYRAILDEAGLDHAVWGHISDGNIHPNILARSGREMESARAAQLAIGQRAIEMGGSPMSEHGTGRNPVKRELLVRLYGEEGVEAMRRVKRALDPQGLLARAVMFDP